ncbi:hypothetical protein AGLY_016894 [Aphis glycines]|uniref:Uncharacterized protein n=1 Tax=Aphis glycines TaxID=307491 RepID=A0A6G0SYE8_APHGL|nr:hypothetical protein AGLY_016894 [Aphis glycines]
MDKLMVKKYIEDDNKEKSLFEIPSRVLVVGASGCVYKKLKKIFNGISSINIHFSDDDIISVDDCEPNSVVVIDDFLLENQKLIMEYFIRSRSKNISVIYLTQSNDILNIDEDEGDNNKTQGRIEYTPKKIQKIINLKKNLQNNYRKTVLNDKYTAEEKVKHYKPILKAMGIESVICIKASPVNRSFPVEFLKYDLIRRNVEKVLSAVVVDMGSVEIIVNNCFIFGKKSESHFKNASNAEDGLQSFFSLTHLDFHMRWADFLKNDIKKNRNIIHNYGLSAYRYNEDNNACNLSAQGSMGNGHNNRTARLLDPKFVCNVATLTIPSSPG